MREGGINGGEAGEELLVEAEGLWDAKLKESLGLLHEMGDSHLEAALLRSCFSFRTSFAPVLPPTSVDCTIREALESILGGGGSD